MTPGRARLLRLTPFPLALAAFVLLATANSAGYRFGASDLAFYGPAVMRQLEPRSFPRDTPLIDAQARLTRMDETVAAIARATTTKLPVLFLGLYLATLVLLFAGGVFVGRAIFRSEWAVLAFLAALTLRHAIARSGTNTLEAYFHPRQLAFAFGALAVGASLRGWYPLAGLLLLPAGLLHPTTTLWFAIWLAAALVLAVPRARVPLAAAAACGGAAVLWAAVDGPLAGRFGRMDAEWLSALAAKDYLFPARWPAAVWLMNLAYLPIVWTVWRRREALGLGSRHERGVALGAGVLVLVFFAALAAQQAAVALAIQLQPARIFWMLDFLAVAYVVWAAAEWRAEVPRRRAMAAAAVVAGVSLARGVYVMKVEFPDRPLFETGIPGDWGAVSRWAAASTPLDAGFLADPGHASAYGTSLRMSAGRDVFVERTKDGAIGMYEHAIALRTRERLESIGDFTAEPPERLRSLARSHGLSYVISERALPFELAFQAGTIKVYRIN